MSDEWIGRTIDNRYVVESTLGSGGMGVVLRARHIYTGGYVALKMLRSHLQLHPEVQERFLAEARAPSSIGHPGIVTVTDAGKTPEGELYLAMELLEGVSLRDIVRAGLAFGEIRRIVLELLDALGAAHARGVVHRDLKPENVFLAGAARTVKLLDFGIAKVVQSGPGAVNRTSAGDILGTLAYMAPEQLRDASKVDPRADLWAVGVMIYEMLSGRLPYHGNDMQTLYVAVLTQQPEPIRNHAPYVPQVFADLLARTLAVDPAQRFATAQELAAAIRALPLDGMTGARAAVGAGGFGIGTDATGYAPSSQPPVASNAPYGTQAPPGVGYPAPSQPYGTQASAAGVPSQAPYGAPPQQQPSMPHASQPPYGSQQVAPAHVPSHVGAPLQQPYSSQQPQPPYGSAHDQSQHGVRGSAPPPDGSAGAPLRPEPRSKWPIAAVAIAAIVGVVVIVVVVTSRGGGTTPPTPGPASGSGVVINVPAPSADATVDLWGGANDERSAQAAACATGCASLETCGLAFTTCIFDCTSKPSYLECFATQDCTERAACIFGKTCGTPPSGKTTCRTAALCQGGCNNDATCMCGCVTRTARTHAVALFKLDACAINCMSDMACVERDCVDEANACH